MQSRAVRYSVPCGRCSQPVRFGDAVCASCGAEVTRELKDALEARLEASSSEYQRMRRRIGEAMVLLVVVAGMHLTLGGFTYLALPSHPTPEVRRVAAFLLAVDCLVAVGMGLGALVAKRHPRRGILVGLVVWLTPQLLLLVVHPLSVLGGVLPKLVKLSAMLVLVRGIFAAREAEALRRELIAG